ncbi:MAG: polyprenyl diphosphate synthase [Oscillospiraceae bacterium]|nr:polyprenyl diphosphate synthase [Oscillospiraceae bacterium]
MKKNDISHKDNCQLSTVNCQLPNHVGIIMDGNRRWAKKRLLPVAVGHQKGAEILRERVKDLIELGVPAVTFYALSTENLSRSEDEIKNLMKLFESKMGELEKIGDDMNARLEFIGDLSVFPENLQKRMKSAAKKCKNNTGTVCRLALNYGARAEILRAINRVSKLGLAVNEKIFAANLDVCEDVDLLIRTGGERRLSNFLLWQASYAELYFTDALWCDFTREELVLALDDFSKRTRKLGK